MGARIDYYALTIESIEVFSEMKTRAAGTNQDSFLQSNESK